jgi:transposase
LEIKIDELQTVVKQLEDKISLIEGSRNSRTSSTAPSHDIGRSNQVSLRVPSGKKSGGQSGHAGHTLILSDTPNDIIDHHPHSCDHCGTDLQGMDSVSFTRRQIVDIPPVSPVYIEHRSHMKTCPLCSFQTCGVFPSHLQAPIQYGARIEAMTGYLSVFQSIPYNRICKLFKDFFGLHLSEGTIDNFLNSLAEKSNPSYENIREQIQQSLVVGADETGCRVGGKKHWFHVWQAPTLTFIASFASRGYAVIEKYFSAGFPNSFYVSDCWASHLKVEAKAHQLCMSHLLRELINFEEKLKRQWSIQMKELFMRAIELKKNMTEIDYLNPNVEVTKLNKELDKLLETDLSGLHPKEQSFIKRLIKHRQSIFTFLIVPDVPPDNNASERAIRNVKVKTKVSGQFRNKEGKGADRYAKIRSVVDTKIKNGKDVYEALVALANGEIVRGLE